jgi:hypothetical protein
MIYKNNRDIYFWTVAEPNKERNITRDGKHIRIRKKNRKQHKTANE